MTTRAQIRQSLNAILSEQFPDARGTPAWHDVLDQVANEAAETRRQARRRHGGYVKPREAMLLAFDSHGRVGDPIDYLTPSRLRIKTLRDACREAKARGATGLSIEGGVDWYETFRDFLDGCDYEPSVEVWEVEVPAELFNQA